MRSSTKIHVTRGRTISHSLEDQGTPLASHSSTKPTADTQRSHSETSWGQPQPVSWAMPICRMAGTIPPMAVNAVWQRSGSLRHRISCRSFHQRLDRPLGGFTSLSYLSRRFGGRVDLINEFKIERIVQVFIQNAADSHDWRATEETCASAFAPKWTVSTQGHHGSRTQHVTIQQDGNKISGSIGGDRGDDQFQGSVDGNDIHFTVSVNTPRGR